VRPVKRMKFNVEHIGRLGERAGHLEIRSKVFPTPFPLLTSRRGSIPNLTRETLEYLNLPETVVLHPYQYHAKQTDVLQQFKKGLGGFVGLGSSLTVLGINDPAEVSKSGYNGNKNVSVWNFTNREIVDARRYVEFVRAAAPDVWVALCDGDTPSDASKKRISKAVKKTLDFLDTCLELKSELKNTSLIAAVEGGRDLSARKYSAMESAKRPVQGFLLDGFHEGGEKAENLPWAGIAELFKETVAVLPKEKPRFYFGPARPDLVLDLVGAGVDVFDASYAHLVTDRHRALVFNNVFRKDIIVDKCISSKDYRFDIELADTSLRLDMSPLVEGCTCYTCRNFTRAYLHHLVVVKEMLSGVLLTLHNLHHYLTFFNNLREAVVCDQVENFRRTLLQSCVIISQPTESQTTPTETQTKTKRIPKETNE